MAEVEQYLDETGLKRYHSHVNDLTTGINLIRGSRDFTRDVDEESDYIITSGRNGFHTIGDPNAFKYTTDEVGFTVATIERTPSTSLESTLASSRFVLNEEKIVTFSGEIKVDSTGNLTKYSTIADYIAFDIPDGEMGRQRTVTFNDLGIAVNNNETWQPFKFIINVSDIKSLWMCIRLRLEVVSTVSFRKLMVQHGEIQNPIWASSPFDMAGSDGLSEELTIEEVEEAFDELDESDPSYSAFYEIIAQAKEASKSAEDNSTAAEEAASKANTAAEKANDAAKKADDLVDNINDMTTGINLLRGTRDFRAGTKLKYGSYFYVDGFILDSTFSFEIDDEGFTDAIIEKTGQSTTNWNQRIYSSPIELENVDSVTCSFDFFTKNKSSIDYSSIAIFEIFSKTDLERKYSIDITLPDINNNEWNLVTKSISIANQYQTDEYFARLCIWLPKNGSAKYRKLMVQEGSINHPIYAPNPNDIDYINDETTGINLLRGTRDFTSYTKLYSGYQSSAVDGFKNSGSYAISVGEDGFSIASKTSSGQTANIDANLETSLILNAPDIMTISFEIKYDVLPDQTTMFGIHEFSSESTNPTVTYVAPTTLFGVANINEIETGKWYKIKYVFNKATSTKAVRFIVRLQRNGSLSLRKFAVYQSHINNPVWSPNPFDVASSYVLNKNIPKYLGAKTEILSNADLNEYTTPGSYACYANTTVTSLKNFPDGLPLHAFTLDVDNSTGNPNSYYRRQTLTLHSNPSLVAVREKVNETAWNDWRQTYANSTVRPIEGGGTGGANTFEATANLTQMRRANLFRNMNEINNELKNLGISFRMARYENDNSSEGQIKGLQYPGAILSLMGSYDWGQNKQILFQDNSHNVYIRWANADPNLWKNWKAFEFKEDPKPYVSGLYTGAALASKFSLEIGSTHIATWLQSRVKAGNFEGLNIGDYVDISCDGVNMRYCIGAIDPYYNCGNPKKGHHIVMVPNSTWALSAAKDESYVTNSSYIAWNTTATNNGTSDEKHPYLNSNLHKWELEKMLPRFPQEWQDAMLSQRMLLEERTNASNNLTDSTGWSWADMGKIWSPSETEVYGNTVWGTKGWSVGLDCQFPIFKLSKDRIKVNMTWWLRTPTSGSSSNVCCTHGEGYAHQNSATYTSVRPLPCFLIG